MFLNIISKFLVWSREIEICRKHLKASIIDVIRIMPGIFFSDILIKDNISKNRLKVQKYYFKNLNLTFKLIESFFRKREKKAIIFIVWNKIRFFFLKQQLPHLISFSYKHIYSLKKVDLEHYLKFFFSKKLLLNFFK